MAFATLNMLLAYLTLATSLSFLSTLAHSKRHVALSHSSLLSARDEAPSAYHTRINWHGIEIDPSVTWRECMNEGEHCIRQLSAYDDYNVTALDDGHANCQKSLPAADGTGQVATGTCHVDAQAGTFLVQCMTKCNDPSYVVVEFAPNSTSFTAFGQAYACLEQATQKASSGLQREAQLDMTGVDISVWCPSYGF